MRRVKLSCLSDPLFLPLAKRNWNYGFTGQSVGWLLRQVDYLHRFLFTSLSTFQFTTRPLTVPGDITFSSRTGFDFEFPTGTPLSCFICIDRDRHSIGRPQCRSVGA